MSKTSAIDRVIGSRLRVKRISMGLDKETLAERIGATEQCIDEFESGTARIGADAMRSFCDALNVRPGYFFEPWTGASRALDGTDLSVAAE
jgi:transcriptional regulator with XRE-family HTH domain